MRRNTSYNKIGIYKIGQRLRNDESVWQRTSLPVEDSIDPYTVFLFEHNLFCV